MKKENRMFPLQLQFFAEDNDNNQNNSDGNGDEQNQNNNSETNNNGNQSNDNSGEKTFTQTQVNNMMAKEKHEGKNSVLKALGFKTEEEAKQAINLYNALINSQKTQEEQNKDLLDKTNTEKDEYFKRAENAENKLLCFEAGVNKDSIDDVLAIASTKVSETNGLENVLKEMKKDSKYSVFFESTSNSSGTGNQPGHSGGSGSQNPGDYGKRLAERSAGNVKKETKSNFF